jgi:hypothetical protein
MPYRSCPRPPAESPPNTASNTAPAAEVPPFAADAAPLCYVIDEDASIRQFLSLILHGSGIDTVEFADGAAPSGRQTHPRSHRPQYRAGFRRRH